MEFGAFNNLAVKVIQVLLGSGVYLRTKEVVGLLARQVKATWHGWMYILSRL
jgi:hypothetical protein